MSSEDSCKLFVAGLPDSISDSVLRQLFEATGCTVVDVSLPRDRATGRPRGFGFVTLATEDEAKKAMESLDGSMQAGRSVVVRPFKTRGEAGERAPAASSDDRTLYLGNLPYDATVDEVRHLLEGAGVAPIVKVSLPVDQTGRPRGFGFVLVGSAEAAQEAVASLQETELRGRRISANVAHARGDRTPRPPRATSRSGTAPSRGAPQHRSGEWRSGSPPDRPPAPPFAQMDFPERDTFDEPRRFDGARRKKEPKAKKKKSRGVGGERQRTRRAGEGFRSPRARDLIDDDD